MSPDGLRRHTWGCRSGAERTALKHPRLALNAAQVLEQATAVMERCKDAPIMQLWDRSPLQEHQQLPEQQGQQAADGVKGVAARRSDTDALPDTV
jgi:hypothetical protein